MLCNVLQVMLRAEWDATNTAEVMKALADPPGPHTIAGGQQRGLQGLALSRV